IRDFHVTGVQTCALPIFSGYFPPESGRIRWAGQDITDTAPGLRPLSILFQDQNLFPHLTVSQNVGLGLRPDLRLTSSDRARLAEDRKSVVQGEGLGAGGR